MKRIITAIGNQMLNRNLVKEKEFEVLAEDIQYQEGILEFLEKEKNIDILILSSLLIGNMDLKTLIEKIKSINNEIQIILFLEKKDEELENYLYGKGIYFIFYHNQVDIKEVIEFIKNNQKNTNIELKKEIDELKKILLEKEKINGIKINSTTKKMEEEHNEISKQYVLKEIKHRGKNIKSNNAIKQRLNNCCKEVICVSGTSGGGKSIFSINLAKSFMEKEEKILIIDFDVLNNSLHTMLGIKKYSEKIKDKIKNNDISKEIEVEELVMKINKKIDLIAGINLLFDSQYKINSKKIKHILEKLKGSYNIIIIDTSSECFFEDTKEIMKLSNTNIFITEANLSEIKKAKNLLNIYVNEWEIPKKNFNILFNKYNENSINIEILQQLFSEYSILGKLSDSSNYNLLINQNSTGKLEKNLAKEYKEISQNIFKKNILHTLFHKNNYLSKITNRILNKKKYI